MSAQLAEASRCIRGASLSQLSRSLFDPAIRRWTPKSTRSFMLLSRARISAFTSRGDAAFEIDIRPIRSGHMVFFT